MRGVGHVDGRRRLRADPRRAGNFEQIWIADRGVVGATLRLFDAEAGHWTSHWAGAATGCLDPPMTGRFVQGVGTSSATDAIEGRAVEVRFVWDEMTLESAHWTQSFAPAAPTTGRPTG